MQQPTHFSWLVPCVQPEGALDSKAASTASRKQGDKNGKCDAVPFIRQGKTTRYVLQHGMHAAWPQCCSVQREVACHN